jgi:DNA topoisomerase-2
MDGLKPSQRKILWASLKRGLRSEIKVAQLAGYVSEHAAYHHGEASLNQTITSMGQIFVGANNINFLNPVGQFGSRLMGGKDAASPRYIHTHLEKIVDILFRKEDEPILTIQYDDGDKIEPETYLPVVPLLVVNGCVGIGTGFSTDIPPHNPCEIVGLLRQRLTGAKDTLAGEILNPWWVGFGGKIVKKDDKQWYTKGCYEWNDAKCAVKITDLPVGKWTKDYKAFLDTMTQEVFVDKKVEKKTVKPKKADEGSSQGSDRKKKEKPVLKDFEDLYNDVDVNFTLYLDPDYYKEAKADTEEFESRFRLTTSWKTTNMCCFDTNMNIVKYATVGDILEEFFEKRIEMYEARRQHQIKVLKDDIEELDAKYRFVEGIVEGRLKIMNEEDDVVLGGLRKLGLPPRSDRENPNTLGAFEYLLRMRVDRIKKSSVQKAFEELEAARADLKTLESTIASEIWSKELVEFEQAWNLHEKNMLAIMQASCSKEVGSPKKRIVRKK